MNFNALLIEVTFRLTAKIILKRLTIKGWSLVNPQIENPNEQMDYQEPILHNIHGK
jgi:hypothetical protein